MLQRTRTSATSTLKTRSRLYQQSTCSRGNGGCHAWWKPSKKLRSTITSSTRSSEYLTTLQGWSITASTMWHQTKRSPYQKQAKKRLPPAPRRFPLKQTKAYKPMSVSHNTASTTSSQVNTRSKRWSTTAKKNGRTRFRGHKYECTKAEKT